MKQQIKRLEEPGLKCCQLVYDELIRILGQLLAKIVRSVQTVMPEPFSEFVGGISASVPSISCAA